MSFDDDKYTRLIASSHKEGQSMMTSPRTTLRLDLSAKTASQYEGTAGFHAVISFIFEGLHYIRYCPHENWDAVDWMTGEGNLAPMSDADSECHSSSLIPMIGTPNRPSLIVDADPTIVAIHAPTTSNMHMNLIQDLHRACSLSCSPVTLRTSQLKLRVSLTGRKPPLRRAHHLLIMSGMNSENIMLVKRTWCGPPGHTRSTPLEDLEEEHFSAMVLDEY